MHKMYTLEELEALPTTNSKLFRQIARDHGMSTKTDTVSDILNAVLTDGVIFEVHPDHSWFKNLPVQGTYTVKYETETTSETRTFATVNAAERFCVRLMKAGNVEITDCNY